MYLHKLLLLITSFVFFGYTPIEEAKNSFGLITSYFYLENKYETCTNCSLDPAENNLVKLINSQLFEQSIFRASSFLYSNDKKNSYLLTSDHVCQSLEEIKKKDENFAKMSQAILDNIILENFKENNFSILNYNMKFITSIVDFEGNTHLFDSILKRNKEKDLCIISTKDVWGKNAKFADKSCEYGEQIFNISASGGFYRKNAVPFRKGYFSGKYSGEIIGERMLGEVNLYTLKIRPGASGSAVFNSKGRVCGNVNIAYTTLDLSLGATLFDIKLFTAK